MSYKCLLQLFWKLEHPQCVYHDQISIKIYTYMKQCIGSKGN